LLALAAATTAQARELVDSTGAKVKLGDRPARVVTLAPSLGELAAELCRGPLSRIVGVSEYTDYPASLAKTPSVGPYAHFNVEKVVALKPDLVLATSGGNAKDQVLRLRELGVPVVVVADASFKDVAGSMRLVARALGNPEAGEKMAKSFDEGLAEFHARAQDRARKRGVPGPRVLLELGDDPLVVVGGGAFLNDALLAVGARNLYGEPGTLYPRPAIEDVVHRDPERIFILALGRDLAPFEKMARAWDRFAGVAAVKQRKVRVLKADALLRPTPRLLKGLAELETAIYGDR
jgi:iron complex transport system substrate-binding protein